MNEKEVFYTGKEIYEELLDNYAWIQHMDTGDLYARIHNTVEEYKDTPILTVRKAVNHAISSLSFDHRTLRLKEG